MNGRIIPKRLHIAIPHIHASTCQKQIIARKAENEKIKKDVRAKKSERVNLKRENVQPKAGYFYKLTDAPTTIQPLSYVDLV